ncbi:sickle tail protein-like [Plectropomus leopardus]|uniref:sickle tail protein-like n=1 Tax=Plectropomus leopardus TaxID=160734 RepID=UPI001C4C2180|nr:sickle tail protein-like [Plectropomus leopardus]
MSKSSSRLVRPGSAGSKSPSLRKEAQSNRSCMLRIGERLMRAGSEGNLVQRPIAAQSQASSAGIGQGTNGQTQPLALEDKPTEHTGNSSSKDPGASPSRGSSSADSSADRLLQKKPHTNSSLLCNPDFSSCSSAPRSPSTLPRSFVTSARASSRDSQLDSLMMQHSEVERKKEVFLDHLRQKYPHHAAIIMGHQERMREQARSPRPSDSQICASVLGLAEHQDPLASETMSDGEVLPPTVPFTRGCKARASLPVGRSSGQTREMPLGVLYLQYGEETKQVRMPAEISSRDALRALFVTAFPHQLTMKMLQSPNMAIYIKDTSRNVYYDLDDIRNIPSHSCLKVYHKDPAHVFNRHARPANTEGRISKEVLYGSHSPVHTMSSASRSTLHSLQGSMSPPMVRSMPSSPSRMAYGGGSTGGRTGLVDPGSTTLPRERLSGAGRSSSLCTSSSAILERRDVKPDEDVGSSKSMALVLRGEGGPHYPDSYCSSLQDGGGRLSIASSQCSAPPSLTADMVDAGVTGIPGGLQQYRASIKPLMGYGDGMEHQTRSLHRQKSRKYGDSQLPPLGTKTPPPSPHRVNEVRMIEGQIIGGVGLVSPDRMSPIRRSLRRDSNGATVEVVHRSRGSGSSSSTSSVFMDSPLGQSERLFQGHVTANNAQSERMKAMEEQIASLAGLVHSALSVGSDIPRVKDAISESADRKRLKSRPAVSSELQNSAALIDSFSPAPLALQTFQAPPSDGGLQQSLVLAKRNVCELRMQLNQLRHLQLSNQESVSSMLRMAGQELAVLMYDRLAQSEEASYRRRAEMEEERIHYLATEERILTRLRELEDYVDHLQQSSTSSPDQLLITLRDVEEGAVNLRRVGETLATLKGEFPELQAKMRSVLRLEVEAVRFLKEEPLKMDSMLKRVKALTEALSSLRRCVSESTPTARSAQVEPLKVLETEQGPLKTQSPQSSPKPQPRSSVRAPLPTASLSGSQAEVSPAGSASPIMARRMNTAAAGIQPQHHHPSPPLTPTHGRDSPSVAKVSPRSREGSPALQRRPGPQHSPTQEGHTEQTIKHTQTQDETTERQTPESSLTTETGSMNQSSTSLASTDSSQPPPNNTDFDQALQEAQDSLMKAIPDLNVSDTREGCSDSASGQTTSSVSKSEQDAALDLTLQASVEQQEDTPSQLSDEVDSIQSQPPHTVPTAALQLPPAVVEPPSSASPSTAPSSVASASPSASPSTERRGRPQVEKPRRTSVDREMKQSPDRAGKSPPPPPPRRFHSVSSGLTTGRSGEVIITTRKEPIGGQAEEEKEKDKGPPVAPQPKPPRQPPEVKPKPQMCAPAPLAGSTSTVATAVANREDEEDEEEDNKFMKELQVTKELSNKNYLSGGYKQWKGEVRKSPTSQLTNLKPSDPATSDHQSAHQTGITNGCPPKLITVVGFEERIEVRKDNVNPDEKKEAEERVIKPMPSSNCATLKKVEVLTPLDLKDVQTVQRNEGEPTPTTKKAEKIEVPTLVDVKDVQTVQNEEGPTPTQKKVEEMEVITVTTSPKEIDTPVKSPDCITKEVVGQGCSPATAEKKVKFTTIVTLQKENIQATDITSPDHTSEKVVKEVPAEKKPNVTVVVTLQKGNTPEDSLIESQQDKSRIPAQDCAASTPVLKIPPLPPSSTYSPSIKQQNQEATEQVSRDESQYTEEGCSLSPDTGDNEGPPPPPPLTSKISLRISRSRSPRLKKEEDLTISGSDMQTAAWDSAGEATYLDNENEGFEDSNDFDKKPIIVILNEPMDIQSAYKRLSTIFECEEDLDGILSADNIVEEEETNQEEEKQGVRKICITEIDAGSDLQDVTGNGQNSLNMEHQRPSGNNGTIPENQDQGKLDLLKKPETKRKFKFKFPKNKLAAISQAIRTGTAKTGKKTVEVVVYEEEEEIALDSKPMKDTKKQTKESKRFEISSTKQFNFGEGNATDRDIKVSPSSDTRNSKSHSRVEKLCKSAFDSIDSLEESIKQLEISVDSMSTPSSPSSIVSSPPQSPDSSFDSTDRAQLKGKVKRERERSPSKRPASQILKSPNPPQSKRAKPQPSQDTGKPSIKKQSSSSSSSSSAQRSHTKSRHLSSSGSPEKTAKGQQQASQKQPSQADSRSSRAAGDSSHSVVALRASKIPALCHSSGKQPSASLSTPHCSDTTDSFQNLSSSSSSSASSPSAPSASSGKYFLLSPPSNVSKCPSHPSSPSSAQRSKQQAFLCPLSSSSLVKNSSGSPPCSTPPSSPSFSPSPPSHKSFIPSLNLSRLLPSSSHVLSPSHANVSQAQHGPRSSSKRQQRLVLTSTSSTTTSTTSSTTSTSQHSYYSSSSYSSSSPSSSSTSSSLSPTSSSSSPPSPSSSLLPTMVSHGMRSVRMSASNPSSPSRSKKRTGNQAGRAVRTTAAAASKDAV